MNFKKIIKIYKMNKNKLSKNQLIFKNKRNIGKKNTDNQNRDMLKINMIIKCTNKHNKWNLMKLIT